MNQKTDRTKALTSERLSALCYQLWMMQKAGAPLEQGISALLDDAGEDWSRALLTGLLGGLRSGMPLSDALRQCGRFPDHLLQMVEIGQATGQLEQVLLELSEYYRRDAALKDGVRRAVTYPALMALLLALVFVILTVRVLPVFLSVFDQMGLSLSPAAAALMRFGSWGKYIAGAAAGLLAVGALALLFLFRTSAGAALLARRTASGKAGATALCVSRSRFASALSLMLASGLPFEESMSRAAALLADGPLAPRIAACRAALAAGVSFTEALRTSQVFDGLQTSLLAAGFAAGVPAQTMNELSRRAGEEADDRLARLLARFEYGLVLALCAAVGLVLLSVMLPLLGVLSSVGI